MAKRVLIFSFAYYPRFVGGAEIAVKEITDRISPEELEFDLISLRLDSRLPKFEKIGNVNVYRVGYSIKRNFSADSLSWYLNLNKYFFLFTGPMKACILNRVRKYDVIWSIMASYSSFAAVLFKLFHRKIPYVLTLQDGDPIAYIKRRALPLYPLFKMIFTSADRVSAISKHLADWAVNMGAKRPVTIVPNAVDYGLFSENISDERLEVLKKRLEKKEGDVFLITTSRLVAKNAVGDIVAALRYLPDNVKLLILGSGREKVNLISKIGVLNLKDRVRFMGYIPHPEMPKYLRVSDIFVRPSLSEGLGNSFLEAMASGIPVIATPVGGIVDFLKDGQTGLFCEAKNPMSIARKVEKLMKDAESREYIVRTAKKMVEEKYEWRKIAQEIKNVLDFGRL